MCFGPFPSPRFISLAAPFLLSVEPSENIEHGLPSSVPEWIDQGNNGRLGWFHGMADFLLLSATNGTGAEVAELKDVAFL